MFERDSVVSDYLIDRAWGFRSSTVAKDFLGSGRCLYGVPHSALLVGFQQRADWVCMCLVQKASSSLTFDDIA